MFLGEYQHTLDSKGRLILPSAYREALGEGLVMTVGHDRCLTIHPREEWDKVLEGLTNLRTTDRRERAFTRVMTSSAHAEQPDKQGRITIPGRLREYAALDRDVSVVGALSYIELWDTAHWERYRDEAMTEFAETDSPFGIGGF